MTTYCCQVLVQGFCGHCLSSLQPSEVNSHYQYPHFAEGETGFQRDSVTSSRSESWEAAGPGVKLKPFLHCVEDESLIRSHGL